MKILQKYYTVLITLVIVIGAVIIISSDKKENQINNNNSKIGNQIYETAIDTTFPVSKNGLVGFPETVEQIMTRNESIKSDSIKWKIPSGNKEKVDRENLPQNPESPNISRYPKSDSIIEHNDKSPQTVSTSFTAATLSGTNPTYSYPPDDMGAVGPTQFIVAVNGRIVSFNKSTGVADGVLNTSMDNFFNSVRNASGTSDPRIRYDRLTQRWFLVIINVSTPNRILIAVSNSSTITASTTWYFYFIPIDTANPPISSTCLADYPTLGLDANALYIGTNNFCGSPQSFNSTDGYVIRKSSISSGGTMVVTVFRGLVATSSSAGPYTPQGVDNFDAGSAEGYFIGVDNATFGTLMIRRVSTPGGTPTISGNISLTVPTTYYPINVRHKGNTGGSAKYLDALDDRLFAAQMRSGRLWTAHNINVTNAGVASATASRDACRWYEIQSLTSTPALVQSGTVYFPNATTGVDDRNYWIPSVNISGQGHVAMVFSTAGTNEYANVGTVGRLSTDVLGTMQTPVIITASSTAYNAAYNRWGDYSYVSVDPNDDMTMWCVHQFCDATNSYGVRAVKLLAPPPATITSFSPATIPGGYASFDLTVNGTSSSGSGFFDPGAGFANRLTAGITGGVVVNSVTYVNPTQVILNLNTTNIINPTGNITITNPDGQFTTYNNAPLPVNLSSFNYTVIGRNVNLKWITSQETNNAGFEVQRAVFGSEYLVFSKMAFVSGNGNTNSPTTYNFTDMNLNSGKYQYRLKQIDNNGNFEYHSLNGIVEIGIPTKFDLSQNYPNPFNPATKIDYQLPADGKVSIRIYDITGREVKTLLNNEQRSAGYYTLDFNGSSMASGVYFYRFIAVSNAKQTIMTKKMVLVK